MNKVKNYLYNMSYQLLLLVVPLVTTPYVARVLRADGIGKYSVSFTIAEYFVMFGLLGIASYGSRQVAYVRDNEKELRKVFWNLNYSRWITMILAVIVYGCYVVCKSKDRALYAVQGITVVASLFDISWYYAGIEKFKITALRNIIVKIISVVAIFLFVKDSNDLILYAAIMSLSTFIGQLVLWKEMWKTFKITRPDLQLIFTYTYGSFKLWLPSIAASIYTSFDKLMLDYFTNETEVGLYVNAQKIVKIATTVTTSLAVVMTPSAANSFKKGRISELNHSVKKSITAVSLIAFPMMFGLMGIKDTLVPWFLGDGYEGVSDMLLISSLLIISLSWSSIVANQVLVASGNEKYYTLAIIVAAILNFGLNVIMIPQFKGIGAIYTSVVAEYMGLFIMLNAVKKIISLDGIFKSLWRYLIAGAIMGVVVYYIGGIFKPTIFNTMAQVFSGVILYFSILIIFRDEFLLQFVKMIRSKKV